MAHFSVELVKNSGRFTSAWLEVSSHDGYSCIRLTKDKLYTFLSRHVVEFSRYASACRRYSFPELCQFLLDQYNYTLSFNVDVHVTKK